MDLRVFFFAGHCIDHNYQRINFRAGGKTVTGICVRAPGYKKDGDEDWAFCLLKNEITGIKYESIDIKTKVKIGKQIILTGYGCTAKGGLLDDKLRLGTSKAADIPKNWGWKKEDSTIYAKSSFYAGEAILCPGDSGGPAFRFTGTVKDKRSIIGVNSRTTFEKGGYSLLSATASNAGKKFINNWIKSKQQKICGVNFSDIKHCK